MPDSPYDINYGTNPQVEYARAMAKYLREKKGFQMTPGMAVLPGSWAHGLGDVVDAISQGRYQDIAGQQDKTLSKRMIDPNYVSQSAPSTVGSSLSGYLKSKAKDWFGGGNKGVIVPGTEPKEITTGSIPIVDIPVEPKEETNYADLVKQRENPALYSGKTKESKAQWDFQQHTNGFGTKAISESEVIGVDEAHQRFDSEWKKAQEAVDKFKPGLPVGPRAALTSLTFNSGQKWMNSGLGVAVQADDPVKTKELFLQYNKSTDKKTGQTSTLATLKERRNQEAQWFDDVTPNLPKDKTGQMNLGGPTGGLDPRLAAGPQGEQVAQQNPFPVNSPSSSSVMTPNQDVPAGFNGVVPPRNPTSTPEQLDAQIMNARPEDRQGIIDQYKKEMMGRKEPTPGGGNLNIPGDINAPVTHMPGPDIKDFMGMGLTLRQRADGKGIDIITPIGEKLPNTIEGLKEWQRQQKAKDITAEGTAGEQVKHYQGEQQTIQAQGEKSKLHLPQLNVIQNLIKDKSNYVGVGSDQVLNAKKILDFMGIKNDTMSQPASMEVLQKLIASSNLAAMEQLRGFGQVRSTDLRWLEQSNATTTNRPEAIQALTDMAKRMHQRSVDIQDLAQKYRDKHKDNLDVDWDKHLSQWTADNPLFEKKEIDEYKDKLKEKVKGQSREAEITAPVTPNTGGPRRYVPGKGWVE